MTIKLIQIGKTAENYISEGVAKYEKRLAHYVKYENQTLSLKKKLKFASQEHQRVEEGKLLLSKIDVKSYLILLDEKGHQYSSKSFSGFLQKKMNNIHSDVVFCIGGPYGFSEEVYKRSDHQLSFSKMTLTHQMVRLFFTEQLYRAFTILSGEKYHH